MSPASLAQSLPPRIRRLSDLAANLWWSWHPEAAELFSTIDAGLWQASVSSGTPNPVTLLRAVAPRRLRDLARDPDFLGRYDAVLRAFDAALSASASPAPEFSQAPVAYFSAEFGLHDSVPIYSGGLGVLAGDHCKEASDLGLPLVGVGLLYGQGYFHQRLSPDGRQEARYTELERSMAPLVPALTPEGTQRQVRVRMTCTWPCGSSGWAAAACICWIAMWRTMRLRTVSCQPVCTAAIRRRGCARRLRSALAGYARYAP